MTKIAKTVTNIMNLSPTHLVSNICHQHRCNQINVYVSYGVLLLDLNQLNNKIQFEFPTRPGSIFQDHSYYFYQILKFFQVAALDQ